MFRLDYISCGLTISSTVLVGRKRWEGWIVAGLNSVLISVIGWETSQLGFIGANVFCLALYGYNLREWSKASRETAADGALSMGDGRTGTLERS